jgi:hypothetical protein
MLVQLEIELSLLTNDWMKTKPTVAATDVKVTRMFTAMGSCVH